MADRKPTRTQLWYLPGAVGLTMLFLLMVATATHALPGTFAAQTHLSGTTPAGNPATGNAPAGASQRTGHDRRGGSRTARTTRTAPTIVANAFAHWVYSGTTPSVITVPVGARLSMDLFINAGSSISVTAQQSYMTFNNAVLQLVDPALPGCVPTTTILPDTTAFDAVLQNEQCNGPTPCIFRGVTVAPGSFAFASGALTNPARGGDFRVATATWCASNGGSSIVRWQFSPPDPVGQHSEIVDESGNEVSDRALYSGFRVVVVGPTATATNTPTRTPTITRTVTGTRPTNTPTPTPTRTPTSTPIFPACGSGSRYGITMGSGTPIGGLVDTGNHCDDCTTAIAMPFPFNLYGTTFNSAYVDSNGTLQFGPNDWIYHEACLPDSNYNNTIFAHWDDLRTDPNPGCAGYPGGNCGIFTQVAGAAPHRQLIIEWRTVYFTDNIRRASFELRLHEERGASGESRFDVLYGNVEQGGTRATVGVQGGIGPQNTQYQCNTGGLTPGLLLTFSQAPCGTPAPTNTPTPSYTPTPTISPTPSNTATATPTPTGTPINTPTTTSTGTPGGILTGSPTTTRTNPPNVTSTSTSTPTSTPCAMPFTDVQPLDYFYPGVRYLYCAGAISGYADGTFRPYNLTTRSQLAKIVVLAEGWPLYAPPTPTFQDVPTANPFYIFVETAYNRGIISGYTCGPSCLEFRPGNNVTRGQLSKIIVLAQRWTLYAPQTPTFQDVPTGSPFYAHVETAYLHNIISGYSCGPACLEFLPGNNATRGQICKIVHLAIAQP